jgi:hypothetical protein
MSVEWRIPWHPIVNADEQRGLLAELRRELPQAHPLYGSNVTSIARRQDCDDVLFRIDDGRVAIVHLTFSGKTEPTAELPWTTIFESLELFVEKSMKPEHCNFESH